MSSEMYLWYAAYAAAALIFLYVAYLSAYAIFSVFFLVPQEEVAIITRFDKFARIARPGLRMRLRKIEKVAGTINVRVQELIVKVGTITNDKVAVDLTVCIEYQALEDRAKEAFYKLQDAKTQITNYVSAVVLARVSGLALEELYQKREEVAIAVQESLDQPIREYGYRILHSLLADVEPAASVVEAMNRVTAAKALQIAAEYESAAEKIRRVKGAEAEAEARALQGKGLANERREIIKGYEESVSHFQEAVHGASAHEVMMLVLITHYLDMLSQLGRSGGTNTILLSHHPGAVKDLMAQFQEAMIVAEQTRPPGNSAVRPTDAKLPEQTRPIGDRAGKTGDDKPST